MNCLPNYVEAQALSRVPVTILDVFDEYALSNNVREDLYKCYPQAKLAHLKSGGNFPYLSRSDEVNLHIQVSYSMIMIKFLNIFMFIDFVFADPFKAISFYNIVSLAFP